MCLFVCNCWLCHVNLGITDESGKTLLELAMKFHSTRVVYYLNSSTCKFGFYPLGHKINMFDHLVTY